MERSRPEGKFWEFTPLITSLFKKVAVAALSLATLVAMNATVSLKAQQIPATTPTTGAVIPVARPVAVQPVAAQPAAQPVAVEQPQPQPVYVPAGDPYGFTNWLNSTRASYGLPAVGYDPNLTNWANVNNSHQSSRGMGHYVMGPARRQNSAMGSYGTIGGMWMASPAHRAALLDPTIRFIGIAGMGAYWTFNAN